jgi:hypothetical protein
MYPDPISMLSASLQATWATVMMFLPAAVVALILLGLGFVLGTIAGKVVRQIILRIKIDKALHQAGLDLVSEKAGFHITVAGFFDGLVKWFIVLGFTVAATNVLGLDQVTTLLSGVLLYVPKVIVAVVILIIATLLGDFVGKIVRHSVKATGIHQAEFVSVLARWSIVIVAGVLPALNQLEIAGAMVQTLFAGIVFAVSLALGLSFGLGGKDAAARFLDKATQPKED